MFRCLKDVLNGTKFFFRKDKFYRLHKEEKDGYVVLDEDNEEHVIGREDGVWFNEHFVEVSDEEQLELMAEYYANMPDHDKEEQEYIQRHINIEIEKATAPLIKALKFYADKGKYTIEHHDLLGELPSEVQMDEGEVAKKALEELK